MAALACLAGQFLNESINTCSPCPEGTFNSVAGSNTWCALCTKMCNSFFNEVFDYGCNSTHDLFCACFEGYTRSLSNQKRCRPIGKTVYDLTTNVISSNFTSWEQVNFTNAMTNTSAVSVYQDCYLLSSCSVWGWVLIALAAISFGILCIGLTWFIWRKKSVIKRQQANADMILDPEKGPLVEQQLLWETHKQLPFWGQENESSAVSDARNTGSLSQFNSGGSDQAGIHQSSLNVNSSDCVTATPYDRPGETSLRNQEIPSASLCAELESRNSSLLNFNFDLRADDD